MAPVAAQAGALLCAIAYHCITLVLSIPVLLVRRLQLSCRSRVPADWKQATFFVGEVRHTRKRPAPHSFRYPVRVALVNLVTPPAWFRQQQRHHLTATEAQRLSGCQGPVYLLTNPISAGYVQNPISVYYCYDAGTGGALQACIAEVTNTPWGERVTFLFDHRGAVVPKALHVSPMMDMHNTWHLKSGDPLEGKPFDVVVNASHPEHGSYFFANMHLRRCTAPHHPNELAPWPLALRYAWLPHRIAFWIYSHAVRLVRKGVPLFAPPDGAYQQEVSMCLAARLMRPLPGGSSFVWQPARGWPWR